MVSRFVTHVELDEAATDERRVSFSARFDAVLADGRRLVVLDDRGWSGSTFDRHGRSLDPWAGTTARETEDAARTVVGPDEPFADRTHEDMAADHWARIAAELGRQGVEADPGELRRLPHDVELGERLRARLP
jgi:hypothetical protein